MIEISEMKDLNKKMVPFCKRLRLVKAQRKRFNVSVAGLIIGIPFTYTW